MSKPSHKFFPAPPSSDSPIEIDAYINSLTDQHRAAIFYAYIMMTMETVQGGKAAASTPSALVAAEKAINIEEMAYALAVAANWPFERARKAMLNALLAIVGAKDAEPGDMSRN